MENMQHRYDISDEMWSILSPMLSGVRGIISEPYTDYKSIARKHKDCFIAGAKINFCKEFHFSKSQRKSNIPAMGKGKLEFREKQNRTLD